MILFFVRCARSVIFGIDRFLAHSLIFTIYLIRPMLGPMNMCPMVKSGIEQHGCTQYALRLLENQPFNLACWNITKRLFKCHPLKK